MKWLAFVLLLLPGVAIAQPACSPSAPNAIACQSSASNLQSTDVLLGQQATGPNRSNQTVKVTLSQVLALPFSSLSVTGGATIGGALSAGTISGSASSATATATGGNAAFSLGDRFARVRWAQDYGSCTWGTSAGNDAGPCINAAIAAAHAAGGGTVMVQAGQFNVATEIVNNYSGVHLVGAGVGTPRDNFAPNAFQAVTRLIWTGAAGGTMFDLEPASTSVSSLYSVDVDGIVFDCASLANTCARIAQSNASIFRFGVSEPRSVGALLTTTTTTDAPGTQNNDIWIYSRSTNASYSPTGIMIDGGQGSSWNVSYNRFWKLYAWYDVGDGIVIGNSDNNLYFDMGTYPQPGATGTPILFAVPGYTSPNGVSVSSVAGYSSRVFHMGSPSVIQGFRAASTLTAGNNAGTAAFTPVSLTTNASAASGQGTLNFASTTGLATGLTANCGTYGAGVIPGTAIATVTSSTAILLSSFTSASVASGTTCAFSYGLTSTAVAGTYTITATGASTFNITAPTGGSSQTGISASGGILRFSNVVLPITGSAVAGDTWTLVVAAPPSGLTIEGVDKANSVPDPVFLTGATGSFTTTATPQPTVAAAATGGINQSFVREACSGLKPNVGSNGVNIGNCGGIGAIGTSSSVLNGIGNNASGFGASVVGGHNNTASGSYSFAAIENSTASGAESVALGEGDTSSGTYSSTRGLYASDRGRYAADCWGGGQFAAAGDDQTCFGLLRATTSGSTQATMTADGNAAGSANIINLPNKGAYGFGRVTVVAFDNSGIQAAMWYVDGLLVTRGASASTTAVIGTPTISLSQSNITSITSGSLVVSADTTNGGVLFKVTGVSAALHVVAKPETVEVQ